MCAEGRRSEADRPVRAGRGHHYGTGKSRDEMPHGPDGDAVNAELASKPDQPGAPCPPVPDGLPDHDAAMDAGNEAYPVLPPGPGGRAGRE